MTNAVIATETFEIGRQLSKYSKVFARECAQLQPDRFVPYPDRDLYDAGWLVCLFHLQWHETPAFLQVSRNQRESPESAAAVIARIDCLMGGFSRMMPGCHVVEHQDRPKSGVLRWLIVLRESGSAVFSAANETVALRAGQSFVFDHSLGHSAANEGSDVCDFLTVDFEVSKGEAQLLTESRGGVNLGPTSDVELSGPSV